MVSPVSIQTNTGRCPHGLIQSSCPICSRQIKGGMSDKSISKEWSYQKCYLAGLQIKSALQHRQDLNLFLNRKFQLSLHFNKNIQNLIQNTKSPILRSSIQIFMNSISFLSKIPKFINSAIIHQKTFNMISQTVEKLVNILGEIKNFIQRKIYEDLKRKAKKFILFCLSSIEDENYQNDETLAIFKSRELRKLLKKIL